MYFVAKPNTEAINFVSAANITDTTQCIAIATLITDLKNYNLWDKMQVIYPFIGGSSGSHGFNLKNTNLWSAYNSKTMDTRRINTSLLIINLFIIFYVYFQTDRSPWGCSVSKDMGVVSNMDGSRGIV